ncbi:MAG: HesA/MoeB/ThiF family protein [Candidatus Eisenbacteria bacterium]|nr:HesA/MoeB/ThiF family protein [Candidatus Eisenbacteria bacterium]MCC7144324.1 HesA/MoeB/ThiF family protein [Candidatus Eisenbacteria bacterium]
MTVPRGRDRFHRQKLNSWIGEVGQERLAGASVLITRVGGLGGPLAQSLVLAGVGRLVIHHEGTLDPEDTHRMVLMDPGRVGEPRAPQAAESLRRINPDLRLEYSEARITPDSARAALGTCDLAIGAAPTFEERLTLNSAARATGKPYLDAAMCGDEGQVMLVHPTEGACLECLLAEPPPWPVDFPVVAPVSATIGNLAAWIALRVLTTAADLPWGRYIHFDFPRLALTHYTVPRRTNCGTCLD